MWVLIIRKGSWFAHPHITANQAHPRLLLHAQIGRKLGQVHIRIMFDNGLGNGMMGTLFHGNDQGQDVLRNDRIQDLKISIGQGSSLV